MCKVPARRWTDAFPPSRVVLVILSLALIAVGMLVRDVTGLVLLGLGAVALVTAVVFPVIRAVEFGFPTGVRVTTALRDRDQELQTAFLGQRGDLGLYTQLMCDDPALAGKLLEAAWARTAAVWRGPVTADLRSYVLCEFVHLLTTHARLGVATRPPVNGPTIEPSVQNALSALLLAARISVVLREFAELPVARIASLTGRPLAEVVSELTRSDAVLAGFVASGDNS
ncbi:hypothetical protein [Cryobacterium sp. MLB-32]|uniref:hypothetical protein n=1 Tax=Cryobacterium sp. MLB-32 TaxID=1529318 RepID=UPI0018CF4016|nr:hypothetical protein [Cryobacterium sp. MLB-32]